jgi:ElaB/YqjD/DUF883 family membrane-anchored ribosome-binding protein
MNTSSTYNDTMNGTVKAAKDLKKNTDLKATEYGSELNKLSEEAGKRVGEVAAQVKDVAEEYMASGREYVERGQTYVKNNPERSIAIALGVGAVLGGLITFAMRKK